MRKIIGYRKVLGVTEHADLQELKTVYRNLMKTWHPDKFQGDEAESTHAQAKSKHIIEAYHFLVSVSPETRAQNLEEYTRIVSTVGIADYEYKAEVLEIKFLDGSTYEYFGVPKAIYVKLVNASAPARFARRHIFTSFLYRSTSKVEAE